MTLIHQSAQSGFSTASAAYASGRPGYPARIDGWIQETLGVGAGMRVLDLGAGTGKFTGHLVRSGAEVIAVEPVRQMRERLCHSYPLIDARQGTATGIPLDSASVDAVFCAQSFHWFATPEALREIDRVLREKGVLGLIWNVRDETCDWVDKLSKILLPYEGRTPRFNHGNWRSVFPADGFRNLQELTFKNVHRGDFQTVVVDRMMSISFIAAQPPALRDDVEHQIRDLLNSCPELGGEAGVCFPYQTFVAWTHKI